MVGDHRHYMSTHMYTTVKSLNRIHKSHKKQNTHYCRWLNMLKFMCFLTDLDGSKIYSRGRGIDFKNRSRASVRQHFAATSF